MATARIEPALATCRIYYADAPAWDARHDLSLVIHYRPHEPGAVDVTLHSAVRPHTRATLRAMAQALFDDGITTVYAHRRAGHRLPGAELMPDGTWRLRVARWCAGKSAINHAEQAVSAVTADCAHL